MAQPGGDPNAVGSGTSSRRRPPGSQHYAPNQIRGDLSAAEERIYEEREDARTIAGGLRKETTPRHERFDGATSIWTEWFNSYNANVLMPYALAKAPPRPALRADGVCSSEGESTGPEWVFRPADSL
eukprot:jgi/Tetstr1/456206/TSEL_042974.t1